MGLPAGYGLRSPIIADLDAVADVLIADEVADAGQVSLGVEYLRGDWSRQGFHLASDSWVAPDHRGLGIGSSLLDRIEERASVLAAAPSFRLRHSIWAGDDGAAAMLHAHGLRPVHHFWHMQIDLVEPIEPGPDPAGIAIGGIEPTADLAAIHAVLAEAFVDDLSHHPRPFDAWVEEETGSPRYDPTLWLIARDGSEVVGALTASVAGDLGWVDYLGVMRRARGRGIGMALLHRSVATFADRGLRRVLVSVDAQIPTGATALYERVGMRVVKRWDVWERSMSGPA